MSIESMYVCIICSLYITHGHYMLLISDTTTMRRFPSQVIPIDNYIYCAQAHRADIERSDWLSYGSCVVRLVVTVAYVILIQHAYLLGLGRLCENPIVR